MKTFLSADRRFLNPQAMENVELKAAVPAKDTENNPLFTQDMPWEIRIDNGYPNVIYDRREQIFHCYYTLFTEDKDTEGTTLQERTQRNYRPRMDRVTSLAYARSKDGIHWEKPSLGLVDWRGSKENNLLFRYAHGTGVMSDERDKNAGRRFKMVTKVDIPGLFFRLQLLIFFLKFFRIFSFITHTSFVRCLHILPCLHVWCVLNIFLSVLFHI